MEVFFIRHKSPQGYTYGCAREGRMLFMEKKTASAIMLALLLTGMLTLAFNIQPAKASGTIYIRADGSVDPPTAPIQRDGDVYILTDNITSDAVGITIEKDNVTLNGMGFTISGLSVPYYIGIQLGTYTNNIADITVRNIHIRGFYYGIWGSGCSNSNILDNDLSDEGPCSILLFGGNNNIISGNNIHSSGEGITLQTVAPLTGGIGNVVSNNTVINCTYFGIYFYGSDNNTIYGNNLINNYDGIFFHSSNNNTISSNNIANSIEYAIKFESAHFPYGNNKIFHNNLVNNTMLVYNRELYQNVWDDGYPSGGNYWSDYTDVDLNNDGIWDHPYVIDANNQDHYPLVNPWTPTPPPPKITGIDPPWPIAYAYQLLTISGEGFVPDSIMNFSTGSNIYRISRERTRFINPNKIEVLPGLDYVELPWKVWVINPDGSQSNKYDFQTVIPSFNDGKKVLDLALQYWDVENATIMTAIARAESGWSPNTAGDLVKDWGILWDKRKVLDPKINSMGSCSWGLWQVLMPAHLDDLKSLGARIDDYNETAKWLRDPNNNTRAARKVWEEANKKLGNGFLPWSAYTNGKYKQYMDEVIKMRVSAFKCPVNVTITDEYGRIISEVENQIPGASFEYFNATDTKIFYLPLNLTYRAQINATDYGNCTIGQITPTESIYETAFSQITFNLTSETVAEFDLPQYDANYTLKVDENGDGLIDYELAPEVGTITTEYDIGITESVPSKTIIGEGYDFRINTTVMNYGAYTETFNVTVYANATFIDQTEVTLTSRNSTTLTLTWNTIGFAKGNYSIKVCATPVSGETDTMDNNLTVGWILVTIPGDVDGDLENGRYDVDLFDAVKLLACYGAKQGDPNFDINCDIDNTGQVFLFDAVILLSRYGQKYP